MLKYVGSMEERKVNYLLEKSGLTRDKVDKRFREIDERMAKVEIGTKLIYSGYSGYYGVVVIDIVNRETGDVLVETPVARWDKTVPRFSVVENILNLRFDTMGELDG